MMIVNLAYSKFINCAGVANFPGACAVVIMYTQSHSHYTVSISIGYSKYLVRLCKVKPTVT